MTEQAGDKVKGMSDSISSTLQPQVAPKMTYRGSDLTLTNDLFLE
jgi:hypothetical protein